MYCTYKNFRNKVNLLKQKRKAANRNPYNRRNKN